MKTLLKFFAVIILSLPFWGCATSGPKYSELLPALSTPPDTGRIYIYRTTVFGAAVQPEVKLNGEVVGKAIPKGFFYVDKKPGTYEILTSTEVDRKLSLLLECAQTRYVRLNMAMGFFVGHVYPELIDSETAEKEIQDCQYTGAELNVQNK
ncbi:MAG: DUF2846 domain-containing protein [Nitrospirota bacterium]|nr:DUF2846 domain-containing protein [Nitrospirota bacterium]